MFYLPPKILVPCVMVNRLKCAVSQKSLCCGFFFFSVFKLVDPHALIKLSFSSTRQPPTKIIHKEEATHKYCIHKLQGK